MNGAGAGNSAGVSHPLRPLVISWPQPGLQGQYADHIAENPDNVLEHGRISF